MVASKLSQEQQVLVIQRLEQKYDLSTYLETLVYFIARDIDASLLIEWWGNNRRRISSDNYLGDFTKFLRQVHFDHDDRDQVFINNPQYLNQAIQQSDVPASVSELEIQLDAIKSSWSNFSSNYPQYRKIPWVENILIPFKDTYGSLSVLNALALVFSKYLPECDKYKIIDYEANLDQHQIPWIKHSSQLHEHVINIAFHLRSDIGIMVPMYLGVFSNTSLVNPNKETQKFSPHPILEMFFAITDDKFQEVFELLVDKWANDKITIEEADILLKVLEHGAYLEDYSIGMPRVRLTENIFLNFQKIIKNENSPIKKKLNWNIIFDAYKRVVSSSINNKVMPGAGMLLENAINHNASDLGFRNADINDEENIISLISSLNPPVGSLLDYLNQTYCKEINFTLWNLKHPILTGSSDYIDFNKHPDIKRFCKLWYFSADYLANNGDEMGACAMRIFGLLLIYAYTHDLVFIQRFISNQIKTLRQSIFNPWKFESESELIELAKGDFCICRYRWE